MLYLSFPHLTWVYWAAQSPLKWASTLGDGSGDFPFTPILAGSFKHVCCWTWSISKKHLHHPMSVGRHRLKGVFIFWGFYLCLSHLGFSHIDVSYVAFPLCYMGQLCTCRRVGSAVLGLAVHRRERGSGRWLPPACVTLETAATLLQVLHPTVSPLQIGKVKPKSKGTSTW